MNARLAGPSDALALALLAAPPVAVFAPGGVATLAIAAAVAIIGLSAINRRWPALGAPEVLAVLAVAVAWGAASALWSIRPDESLKRALQLAGIFAAGAVLIGAARGLHAPQRRRVAVAAAWGIALALGLVFVEKFSGGALRRLFEPGYAVHDGAMKRMSTLLVLLLAAPAAFLWRDGRRAAAVLLVLGVGAATFVLDSVSARAAWVLGVGVAVLAWFLPRVAAALLAALIAAAILAAPVAPRLLPRPDPANVEKREGLPPSAAHRAMIWHYAADKIAERPLSGHGLDSARSLPDARKVLPWDMGPQPGGSQRFTTIVLMPLHPHNAPLQWWLELGLPGAVLGAAAAFLALVGAVRSSPNRADRAASLGLVAAGMTVAAISYGAWQSWWLLALFLAAAGMAAAARSA